MLPVTHLMASWLVAAKSTKNLRDCRLVALGGILPDVDGLPGVVDSVNQWLGRPPTIYYFEYHHYWLHGLLGGLLIAALLTCFARQRWRVFLMALAVFHLHLLCDLVGSRGPDAIDLWPVYYFGPLTKDFAWVVQWQWPLDGWQNRVISVVLLGWCLALAIRRGDSIIGVFSRRVDGAFVRVLRNWYAGWAARRGRTG